MPLLIALIVALGLLPSMLVLALARGVHPTKVDASPYRISAGVDADQRGLAWLKERRFAWQVVIQEQTIVVSLQGAAPSSCQVLVLRPDDASADLSVPWSDVTQPLRIPVSSPGRWRVRLEGYVPQASAAPSAMSTAAAVRRLRLVETRVDVGM